MGGGLYDASTATHTKPYSSLRYSPWFVTVDNAGQSLRGSVSSSSISDLRLSTSPQKGLTAFRLLQRSLAYAQELPLESGQFQPELRSDGVVPSTNETSKPETSQTSAAALEVDGKLFRAVSISLRRVLSTTQQERDKAKREFDSNHRSELSRSASAGARCPPKLEIGLSYEDGLQGLGVCHSGISGMSRIRRCTARAGRG